MARSGDTSVEFNPRFFETVLRQPQVEAVVDAAAQRTLAAAKANAPSIRARTGTACTSSITSPGIVARFASSAPMTRRC